MKQQKKRKDRSHPPREPARWRSPRRPLGLLPEDEWLAKDTWARRRAYENEAKSTETGRRALVLCSRARELGERNSLMAAHALYLEAAQLFAPDDVGAAAAWCWHCLAESFPGRPGGVRRQNLEQARTFYRRALSSPQRRQDPYRTALSQDGLARCLRDLAEEYGRPSYLDEAKELLIEACATTVGVGAVGWTWMVQHLHSLGNLCLMRGEVDAAIEVFEESHRHWEALAKHPGFAYDVKPGEKQNLLFSLASARIRRFRTDDRKRIAWCLDQVIASGQPPFVDLARILRAQFLLRRSQGHRAEAMAELDKVIVERLREKDVFFLASAFVEAGRPDRACAVLTEQMHQALDRRKSARADHVADHHAGEALRYALHAAYLYVEAGDPIHAFLVLEQVSGNRYFDKVTLYAWRPCDPVTKLLDEQRRLHADMSTRLEDFAGWLASLPDDPAARERFSSKLDESWIEGELILQQPESLALHSRADIAQAKRMQSQFHEILQRALEAPAPAAFLQAHSDRFAQMHDHYRALCHARDPSFEAIDKPWMRRMTVAGLEAIAREQPEHVFVRIHVLDDLLVTSIWWDGTRLTGRALKIAIPGGYASLRQALKAAPGTSSLLPALLAELDLSSALPPAPGKHAVLLPSLLAARLPLAALGPPGRTLLDHFEALSWLPTVVPLWMRQVPRRPRRGILSVIPGHTKHHDLACKTRLDDETVLRNEDATLLRLLAHVQDVDVVSFYTHGRHATRSSAAFDTPGIQLHSDPHLAAELLSERFWAGMERVEIWACESGVDRSLDPRTPLVDEAFGFDAMFHHWGVRSTIASLWKVPDFVTACLVNHYRQKLQAGLDAPHALAAAQRWWRDEAVPRLHDELRSRPEHEAIRVFTASLGLDEAAPELDAELGPVSPSQPAEERIAAFIRKLSSPISWAGIRFLGVAERRPGEPWNPAMERLPTDAEMAELEALLTPPAPAPEASSESIADQPPTPDAALAMARRYRDRPLGASRHNLLRGLAWLHEAMLAADLAPSRWIELAIEAAWMWLDLARSEAMTILDVTFRPASRALLLRVERLLAGVEARGAGASLEARAIRLWLDVLDRCRDAISKPAMLREIVAMIRERAAVLATEVPPGTWQSLRALGELMDLVALGREIPVAMAENLLAPLDEVTDWQTIPAGVASRVLCAAVAVSNFAGLRCPFESPSTTSMTQRNVVRGWFSFIASENQQRAHDGAPDPHDIFSRGTRRARDEDLNWIDACYWDYPDTNQARFWESTGTSGPAHRRAIATYIEGQILGSYGAELATEMLASLQRLCDLRLLRLHLWARLFGRPGMEEMEAFWQFVRVREHFLELLDDASRVHPLLEYGAPPADGLTRCDPFFTTTEDVLSAPHSGQYAFLDATTWYLASQVHGWRMDDPQPVTATAAFEAERLLARFDRDISAMWPPLLEGLQTLDMDTLRSEAPQLIALQEPFVDRDVIEPLLRALPESWILVGVAVSSSDHLVAAATMNIAGAFVQRAYRSPDPNGHVLAAALAALQSPHPPALELTRAISTGRRSPWERVCSILEPLLDALIPAELRAPHLLILAPGGLRSLPWAGLPVRNQPLHRVAHTIRLLPAIGFMHHAAVTTLARGGKHACLLAENLPEQSDGETRFGAAAIRTLRRWFPPDAIIEPAGPVTGRDIVEVDAIEAIDHELASLRMYGVATEAFNLNTSTSGLALSNQRVFSHHNTRMTKLPVCECVELWAETGCEGAASLALQDDRDRIPGLAWSFLSCGANGVVDLAWPVHDLVKALVCEHFGILRQAAHEPAPDALQRAIAWTASTLEVWRSTLGGFSSVADALASLDDLRRHEAARRGLRTDAVQPFAVHADIPCVATDLASLIDEVCQPVHLGAFRYWGT